MGMLMDYIAINVSPQKIKTAKTLFLYINVNEDFRILNREVS